MKSALRKIGAALPKVIAVTIVIAAVVVLGLNFDSIMDWFFQLGHEAQLLGQ